MTDYYIFRHGDTIQSDKRLLCIFRSKNTFNLPILPKSVSALEGIGSYLKNIPTQANFVSPFLRCKESAKIVSQTSGKNFATDDRIRELERNGESFESLKSRVRSFIASIEEEKYQAVSICTHGAVIAGLIHLLTKGKFYFYQVVDYPDPGNITIIKNGVAKRIDFNTKLDSRPSPQELFNSL